MIQAINKTVVNATANTVFTSAALEAVAYNFKLLLWAKQVNGTGGQLQSSIGLTTDDTSTNVTAQSWNSNGASTTDGPTSLDNLNPPGFLNLGSECSGFLLIEGSFTPSAAGALLELSVNVGESFGGDCTLCWGVLDIEPT